MKIIAVYGSARKKGFSAKAVDEAVACLDNGKNEIKKYYLSDMNMKPCRGCFACRRRDGCVQKDDMTALFDDIVSSDFVIFSSPVYCFDTSAYFKAMWERLYPMLGGGMALGEGLKKYERRYPSKKCMMILSMGSVRIMCSGVIRRTNKNLKVNGFDNLGTVVIDGTYGKKSFELSDGVKSKIQRVCRKL